MNWNNWSSAGVKTNGLNIIDQEGPSQIHEGERVLWMGVIYQAWIDAISPIKPVIKGTETRKRMYEMRVARREAKVARQTARDWFQKGADAICAWDSKIQDWVRLPTFQELCGTFDLDADALREQLKKVISSGGFRRRNFIKMVTNRRTRATGNPVHQCA